MRRWPAKSSLLTRLLASTVLCAALVAPASPAAAAPAESLCSAPARAAAALQARIAAHNARPRFFRLPAQAAAYAAYNAEAARLNAEKATVIANMQAWIQAMKALADSTVTSLDLPTIPKDVRSKLDAAKKQIPAGWKPPAPPAPGERWLVPKGTPLRPLFDILRAQSPGKVGNVILKGKPKPPIGAPDPAYPASSGRRIGANAAGQPNVQPDHIIPLARLVNMPGFTKLSAENMYVVARAPLNYQWLSPYANKSKNSRSVAGMSGIDPQWQAAQLQLENRIHGQLQDIISKLLKSQG